MGRHKSILQLSLIIIILIFTGLLVGLWSQSPATRSVTLGHQTYHLEIAASMAAKEKGLSSRNGMPANHGMEFPYAVTGQQCFWMKDMHFSLDTIWLDSAHKVVQVVPDLAPSSYPHSYCALAEYVVELNAGQAARAGIHLGQTAYGL